MLLEKLSNAHGVAGNEIKVAKLLKEELEPYVDEFQSDYLGNLIAIKGKDKKGPKVMISAHMDEIGLMITSIERNGLLKFRPVGGIDPRVLVSKTVQIGDDLTKGVIGAKPIHLQKPGEREVALSFEQLFIDIGAKSEEDAKRSVKLGDYCSFDTQFGKINDQLYKGKAFDDRVGCAILAEILKSDFPFPIYGAFTVQEEVGLRGATVAAYSVNPDIAIVLEGTSASDVPESVEHRFSTRLGHGPALSVIDASIIVQKNILKEVVKIAEANNIPYQYRQTAVGGNDAGKIHLTREGIQTFTISVPCRYIHSPVSLMNGKDFENTIKLVSAILKEISQGGLR
ncbi:endoglucanase [Anaerobranca californiensis DSM 14826]|jgi:endoglucanase|uniref:Endoglucanase n=1 Tax=Anaerobranca californiensis DSM 14826 TaxID=1120989 RepID=A0A1M6KKT6_9FIRM|nr:M42 family metallopeptidase [Anaerobranca californiensis]SHJ59574.1 endoglucanase [Anaerobranca californiensis DSM 14826]